MKHRVSGKWSPSTVLDLIRNSAIIGDKTYGVRSEGKHRRLGHDGWRYLNDMDRDAGDDPKVVRNPEELVVRAQVALVRVSTRSTGTRFKQYWLNVVAVSAGYPREGSGKIPAQWSRH